MRDVLHTPRFADQAPAEVYATLLDEGTYRCSERTMYGVLTAHRKVRKRRDVLRHPSYAAPELLATQPNQLWSWGITKLLGPTTWTYFYLYVILHAFSRYIVGRTVAYREAARIAEAPLALTYTRQGIVPGQLTVHADRSAAVRSKPVTFLPADLRITKTHARPHVSNDNPYSEAQFKTFKYRLRRGGGPHNLPPLTTSGRRHCVLKVKPPDTGTGLAGVVEPSPSCP